MEDVITMDLVLSLGHLLVAVNDLEYSKRSLVAVSNCFLFGLNINIRDALNGVFFIIISW